MQKIVYFVVGPTAVGKTSFAIRLAQHLGTEIVSADSRQFFREMNIGTACPSREELKQVKHHLIGNLSIHDSYNVSAYESDALGLIKTILADFGSAVVVGGSGLYLDALAYGIDDLPDASSDLRMELAKLFDKEGITALQKRLELLDPVFYAQIDKQNPKRLLRALEVCMSTGKPYSEFRMGQKKTRPFSIRWIGLEQERSFLNERINLRVDKMLEDGLLNEVKQLYPYKDLNALNTVGYKEFFAWMDGTESLEWAIEKVKTNSRRYAKRQMTWFRKNTDIHWFDVANLPSMEVLLKQINHD